MSNAVPIKTEARSGFGWWLIHFLVVVLCGMGPVPDVNEPHYLPKAKHFWDAGFAPGDLFLESHDSHFLASGLAGLLAQMLSLATVAWIGRSLSWAMLAWAWCHFSRSLRIPALLSPVALAAWYLATHYGHWAGEWAVGGFEAKSIAYPCVLLGLAAMQQDRWKSAWIWLGLAVAWHPIVGGWAGISVGLVWLWLPNLRARLLAELPWLGLAVLFGLVGVVPALMGIGGVDRAGDVVASQVHVFLRLQHHLCPRTFDPIRHYSALASVFVLLCMTLVWAASRRKSAASGNDVTPLARLIAVAWISVVISLLGLAIDLALAPSQPALASMLLRFYWFRWSDIAVPLAWTSIFWSVVTQFGWPQARAEKSAIHRCSKLNPIGQISLLLGVGATCVLTAWMVNTSWSREIPAADDLVVNTRGPYAIDTDRHVDWLAACQWIRQNSPEDSLWFTPRNQQTFKWYAQRAEVVCWKDVPQDNASVLEWYSRIQRTSPPRDRSGKVREWTTEELTDLSQEYGFEWILLDRTFQRNPPLLELMYPINIENRSFAVFRMLKTGW